MIDNASIGARDLAPNTLSSPHTALAEVQRFALSHLFIPADGLTCLQRARLQHVFVQRVQKGHAVTENLGASLGNQNYGSLV